MLNPVGPPCTIVHVQVIIDTLFMDKDGMILENENFKSYLIVRPLVLEEVPREDYDDAGAARSVLHYHIDP